VFDITEISKFYHPAYIKNYENFDPAGDTVLYSGPYWDHEEIAAILKSVLEGNWIVSGNQVEEFQQKFADKFRVKRCHMVNSGSSANLVMITALKKRFRWKDGDEIIVSPVGFPTTIAPIVQNNLKPRFIDIEMSTLNFDLEQVESAVNKKTRAIFVSPVLGNPPDLDRLTELCQKHGILLIGDNCDSLGSTYNGRYLGEYYHSWTCSFYPAHHISTGEGGMIATNDLHLIDLARSISWWGRDCYCTGTNNTLPCGTCGKRFSYWLENYDGIIDHKYIYSNIGYNLKPLDLQGAVGIVQLSKSDKICELRRHHKKIIEQHLVDHLGLTPVTVLPAADPSWFGVPVICQEQGQKEMLVDHFESHRIQTRNYFGGNILLHPAYSHLADYRKYPQANTVLDHVFFLGCAPSYTPAVLDYIKAVIEKW
jgi:dTDP-4-amino-4,6-dideoxygalactose transaminase